MLNVKNGPFFAANKYLLIEMASKPKNTTSTTLILCVALTLTLSPTRVRECMTRERQIALQFVCNACCCPRGLVLHFWSILFETWCACFSSYSQHFNSKYVRISMTLIFMSIYSPYWLTCPYPQNDGHTFLAIRRVLVQFWYTLLDLSVHFRLVYDCIRSMWQRQSPETEWKEEKQLENNINYDFI